MNATDIFVDFASRPIDAAKGLPNLAPTQLNAHPGGHDNSIAWLLWHAGREVDMQLSQLNGSEQVWTTHGFKERFALDNGDSLGYGHSAEEARSIVVNDQELLVSYVIETLNALIAYAKSDVDWDEVIDRDWTPAVCAWFRLSTTLPSTSGRRRTSRGCRSCKSTGRRSCAGCAATGCGADYRCSQKWSNGAFPFT